MRWTYLGPRLLIVALLWAFFAFAFDPLVRWSLVRTGQAIVRARVEIADVDTRFFPLALELEDVRVANRREPGTNLFEFDTLRLQVAGTPLMYGALVVDEGTLSGLRWGTPRDDSGLLDDRPGLADRLDRIVQPLKDKAGELARHWLDDVLERGREQLDPRQLETVQLAEQLEDEWKARFAALEERIRALEGRVDAIGENTRRSEGDVLRRVQSWQQVLADVDQLLREAAAIRNEITQLHPTATRDYQRLDEARRRDVDTARQKVETLTNLDGRKISEVLFGRELIGRLEQIAQWAAWTREKLGGVSGDLQPERSRGIDVAFPRTTDFPRLLVRKLALSGETQFAGDPLAFTGVLTGLTSDPPKHGQPAVLRLTATGRTQLEIEAAADHTGSVPEYNIAATYTIPDQTELDLGGDDRVQLRVAADRTRWHTTLRLSGEDLTGHVSLRQDGVVVTAITAEEHESDLTRVLASILQGIDNIEAAVDLSGTGDDRQWTLQSNLGPQLATGLNTALSAELSRRRDELLARIDAESRNRLASFATLVNSGFRDSSSHLDLSETAARRLFDQFSDRSLDVPKLFRR
jgi:uncharacterized protein (TIGR03545 family)